MSAQPESPEGLAPALREVRGGPLDVGALHGLLGGLPAPAPALAVEAVIIGGSGQRYQVVAVETERPSKSARPTKAVLRLALAPPPRDWEPISEFQVPGTAGPGKTFTIRPGHPVKVLGKGRGGAAQSGWEVVSAERHVVTGKVNVTVVHRAKGKESVVASERIQYQRPRKVEA